MPQTYRIMPGSSGSFLCPPGHPAHRYEIVGATSKAKLISDPNHITSLEYAASEEGARVLPPEIVRQAKDLLAKAVMVCSENYQRYVYGYFGNSYSPDGTDRNVSHYVRSGPPEHHGGYLLVRSYFPDHQPRLDLIGNPAGGYGSAPCIKCGTALQYEAVVDAFAEPITARTTCPKGGNHTK